MPGRVFHQSQEPIKDLDTAKIYDYELPTWSMGMAIAEFNGRFPETGRSANVGCELAYYVISGSGTIYSERGTFKIGPSDVYIFKKGEKYYVIGKNLKVLMPSSPAWQGKDFKWFPDKE
jgi:hypothetical protein